VRFLVTAALLATTAFAHAEPARGWIETSGFVGVDYFGPKTGLGDALAPEQIPQTSPTIGGRLTYVLLPLGRLQLAMEGELGFTPSWTGYGFDGPRQSYFAPVIGYRGSVLLRFDEGTIQPHLLVGAGGETVTSGSPFMTTDTDPLLFYGVGATFDVAPDWQMRIDGRQGFMPARDGSTAVTYQAMLGIGTRWGAPPRPAAQEQHVDDVVVVEQPKPGPPKPEPDTDGDGVIDRLDKCPLEPATKTGMADPDRPGCPMSDPDGDGIVGAADKCPDQAEDFDKFQDDDGCPDLDNDGDGIVDAKDKCPNDAETKNGFDDDDGCPDTVPEAIASALVTASGARFEPGRVRLSDVAKASLDKAVTALRVHPTIHMMLTGHPEGDNAIAKKRAEVVKWYFVEQGIPADQIDVSVGSAAKIRGPQVELAVAPK
jgi:OOP family OmpA-OmpF porin